MKWRRSELYHHGVQGQKWGVRNGPPYPIEDKILRKGTRLNSVSGTYIDSEAYRNNGKWMYTYNPDDEWDNAVYKGQFAAYMAIYRGAKFVKEHRYEVIKDLRMPTKQQRIQEFSDLLNDKKFGKKVRKDLDKYQRLLVSQRVGNDEEQKRYKEFNSKNVNTENDLKTAYEIFNHAMEAVHLNVSTKEYAKRISEKYDAMVDDNNQGIYNDAHDPVIIFRANEVLKDIGNAYSTEQFVTADQINQYRDKIRTELAKKGMHPKL